jgi:hypothetical protein
MTNRIPFTYGEFYDVPRMIRFRFAGKWFFLSSSFDDDKDDYNDFYDVFVLPFEPEEEMKVRPYYWVGLPADAYVGQISIAEVGLDQTLRQSIDAGAFEKWLSERKKASG